MDNNPDLELTQVAGDCKDNDCPKVFKTNRGTVAFQGDQLHFRRTPEGEAIVELPLEVVLEAFRALGD